MNDHRGNILQYGHLGTATYLPDVQSWEFSRATKKDRTLTLLKGTTISPRESGPSGNVPLHEKSNLLLTKKENFLLDAYPQLAPTLGVIGQHEASSQAITESLSKFDPLVSTRCALGYSSIVDGNRTREQTVPISVFASAESPASLSLYPLISDSVEMPLDFVNSVEVPVIDYEVNALWTGSGSPIQEIVASEALDGKSLFFAVRFSLSTVVLRPVYQRTFSYGNDALKYDGQRNFLNANKITEIPNALTGSHPHAGVTFNPWYQRQFAIVDRVGNWSVWDLQGRQPYKGSWSLEPGASGSLDTLPANDPSKETEHYDGWAAILWVGNVHQLLVCDRRTVVLFRTDAYPPEAHVIDLPFKRQSEWVLSVSRSKHNVAHVFIVTSTRVLWVSIPDDIKYDAQVEGRTRVLLSWRHFRDLEDTSITQSSVLIQNEIYLVLYSRLNALAQLFLFSMSPEDPTVPVSVSDPTVFSLPAEFTGDNPPDVAVGNIYSSILLKEVKQAVTPNSSDEESVRIIKFIGQSTDLRMVESLYVTRTETRDEFEESIALASIYPSKTKAPASVLSSKRAEDHDFITDDQETHHPSPHLNGRRGAVRGHEHLENWEKWHVSICSAVEYASSHGNTQSQAHNFLDWLGTLPKMLQDNMQEDLETREPRTMLDIFGDVPILNDIDENPRQLENTMKDIFGDTGDMLPSYRPAYLPLPISSEFALSSTYLPAVSYDLGISQLYDSLVLDWLSPLPEKVPGKIRIFKEKIIRVILTELIMSRIVVFPAGKDHAEVESSGEEGALPSQSAEDLSQMQHHGPPSSVPTLPSSEDIRFTPSSSQPTQPLSDETDTWNYSTLRRYTSLKPQPPIPRRLATTLSHWRVGSDPSTYDWQTTARTLQEDEESQAEGSQASQKRKRRQERRKKSQSERESRMSNASSSLPPAVRVGGSQPEENFETKSRLLPSSQIVEEGMPMSQTVRGQFGSRETGTKPMVKARKKKRAAGF